jgi:dihydrofolate reductase
MSVKDIPIYAIVAMCDSTRGIGFKGLLPWSIPNDFNYFVSVSTKVNDETKRNAVICGRLTFESMFKEFDSPPDYFYTVVSTTVTKVDLQNKIDPSRFVVCTSYSNAVDYILNNLSDKIENIFAIGGTQIYKNAMEYKKLDRLYLTHVYKYFECDTFLEPDHFLDSFEKIDDFHVEGFEIDKILTDPKSNVQYRFVAYRRKCHDCGGD